MNTQVEKEIIRTLVAAGHEPLAKKFAQSRRYGVKENVPTSIVAADIPPELNQLYTMHDDLSDLKKKLKLDKNGLSALRNVQSALRALEPFVKRAATQNK